jgi:iron complex outermembrane receptor protein
MTFLLKLSLSVLLRREFWAIAVFAVAFPAHVLAAQGDQTTRGLARLSLAELAELEVTSVSKTPDSVLRTPAAVYVLTQEDIRRSGATSLAELLRFVPGVQVARINSDKWAVGARGFASRLAKSMLVLIDGRSVYTPLFAGVLWEVQDVVFEDVERIEIIRGPGGAVWGPNAINGVVNIITKKASDTHGVLTSAGGGSVDQGFGSFRFGSGVGDFLNYRLYGKTFTRGPQFHSDGNNFDDWRMTQGGFRSDWSLNAGNTLTVQGDMYTGEAGAAVAAASYTPPATTLITDNAEYSGGNLLARWEYQVGRESTLRLQSYYDRTIRHDLNFGETRDTWEVDVVHNFGLPRQGVVWGLGARISPSDTTLVVPTVEFVPARFTDKVYSAFVQDEIMLFADHLWLTLGSKFLHNDKSGFAAQPSARLLWAPTPHQSVWAGVSRAVRTPSRVEEHLRITAVLLPTLPAFLRLTGDGGFTPEELIAYEAGYRVAGGSNFFLQTAFFYNDYDDLLSSEASAPFLEFSPFRVILPVLMRNGVTGSTMGAEIGPNWAPVNWWQLKASYSYLNINLRNKPGSIDGSAVRSTEGSSPRHHAALRSLLDLPASIELDVTFRYAGALPALSVPGYSTADARVGWRISPQWDLSFAGQNLLQPHHVEFGNDPRPNIGIKRGAYAKLTWTHESR